jgi:TonB family protein
MFRSRCRGLIPLLAVIFFLGSGCVYFNTFFHARQKFNEAEKSLADNNKKQQQSEQQQNKPAGQNPLDQAPSRPQPSDPQKSKVSVQERQLFEAAIDKAKKVLANHPNSSWADDALWLIGKSYFNLGDYLQADRKFKEIVTNHPKSKFADESYYYMGLCQINLGHNDQALSAFLSLEDSDKKSPYIDDILYAKGAMELISENFFESADFFAQYTEKFPGEDSAATAAFYLGYAREKLNDHYGAFKAYSSVEKFDPSRLLYFDARLASATAALKSDSIQIGMEILDRLARDERYFSRSAEIKLRVAEGLYLQKEVDKAIEAYNDIISSSSKTEQSAEAYYRLGLIYQNDKFDLAAAKDAFAKAQQESPGSTFRNLALARSAQIAKLEAYREQLQRADSLRKVDELNSLGSDMPQESSLEGIEIPASQDTVAFSEPPVDSVESTIDTLTTESLPSIPSESVSFSSLSDAPILNPTISDSAAPPVSVDSSNQLISSQGGSSHADSTNADSLRFDRISRLLDAPSSDTSGRVSIIQGDTASQAIPEAAPAVTVSEPQADESSAASDDSIRAAILQAGIETRFLLSELYAFELNRPDSAIHEFLLIADQHPESHYAPKALFSIAQIELSRGDTAAAKRYLRRLITEHPEMPQAVQAAELLSSPLDMSRNALGLYSVAESLLYQGNNPDSAIAIFKYIAEEFPDLAPKSAFAIAWILDRIVSAEDSAAYFAYSDVVKRYPETIYARAANERLGVSTGQNQRRPPVKQTQPEAPISTLDEEGVDTSMQVVEGLPPAPNVRVPGQFTYPEALLSRELKGKVIFKIKLNISGKVEQYEIIGPSGEYAIDSSATVALLKTEFDVAGLDLAQLDGYFQYSIPFKRPIVNIFNDPYRERQEGGP